MLTKFRRTSMLMLATLPALAGCNSASTSSSNSTTAKVAVAGEAVASPCTGTWPAYWQDPAFAKQGMWQGQTVSDTPDAQNWNPQNPAYTNAPFQLADAYAQGKPDAPSSQPWTDAKFDPLFKPGTAQADRDKLAKEYGWAVMHYIQEGNIDSGNVNTDWNHCANKVRQWFNMPFQTYDVMTGREFIHGLTREAPVTFSVASQPTSLQTTVWAVGFYNGNAAPALATVWKEDGTVATPTTHFAFAEGTVIGKLLFTTATPANMPFLTNSPSWTANLSTGIPGQSNPNGTFCSPPNGSTMPQQSALCKRSPGKVTLMQFDIATRDSRAPNGWVFGTFVADGQFKAGEKNPWNRISLLGLIWGNDTPPTGQLASTFPADPKKNGFTEGVIAWDVVDRLNKSGGSSIAAQPGHLGCNSRLNGPADNVNSSCTSCHMTASVPDSNNATPPLLAQFGPNTPQCAAPNAPTSGQKNNVTYAQMDSVYFAETKCASPFQDKINGVCVFVPAIPVYTNPANPEWISTDFSLQLSGALVSWNEWQGDVNADKSATPAPAGGNKAVLKAAPQKARVFASVIPERGE